MDVAIVLGLLVIAVVLFATERVPVEIATLLLLLVLSGTGILTPAEAFGGFGTEIIIVLGSIFILSAALQESGILEAIGQALVKKARRPRVFLLLLMIVAAAISAFMNNTVVTAMLIPATIGIANRLKTSTSRLLMPLAYASILGGTCTLIGTSTNLAVSGYLQRAGLRPLSLFEIAPIGLIIVVIGIVYLMLFGWRLLAEREKRGPPVTALARDYICEIVVLANSPLIGQLGRDWELSLVGFRALQVIRGAEALEPDEAVIQLGDVLLVEGKVEDLIRIKKIEGFELKARFNAASEMAGQPNVRLAEVLVLPRSDLVGRRLDDVRFSSRYGVTPLAIYRHGHTFRETLSETYLEVGDVLLVEGQEDRILALDSDRTLLVLREHRKPMVEPRKGMLGLGLFMGAIVVGGFGWAPLSVCLLAAAACVVLLGLLPPDQARSAIDLRLLILIGGMTAFGTAMQKTGAAQMLANYVVTLLSPYGTVAIMGGFVVLTIILTQPMSNAAAALVVLPVAMSAAQTLGADPRTFAITVMLGASVSFVTPFEPSCMLVYGPGNYRFRDFVKVGAGLTLILIPVILYFIPKFWPLR